MGRYALTAEQVANGAAGLRNGFFYSGHGEPPHAFVREGSAGASGSPSLAGGTLPLTSIFRPPSSRSIVSTRPEWGTGWSGPDP